MQKTPRSVVVFLLLLCQIPFDTKSHFVAFAGLEPAMQTSVALNAERYAYLCLLQAGAKGVHQQAWLFWLLKS